MKNEKSEWAFVPVRFCRR